MAIGEKLPAINSITIGIGLHENLKDFKWMVTCSSKPMILFLKFFLFVYFCYFLNVFPVVAVKKKL